MAKLLMLKGLPASGKSTYAKELEKNGWIRVNKDDIRKLYPLMKENDVIKTEDDRIIASFVYTDATPDMFNGYNVVVDDCNLNPFHEERLRKIADKYGAEFEIKFFDTPLDECIKRDSLRAEEERVGEKVIMDMHMKYLEPKIEKKIVEYNPDLPDAYIFDIDGTLANRITDRGFYQWDRVGEDKLNIDVYKVLMSIVRDGNVIIIVSGRDGVCRDITKQWLKDNNVPYDYLCMRDEKDNRKDTVIKEEIYHKYIEGQFNILGVFDDRNSVVKMWRDLGLTCFQVAEGNF